MARTRMEARLHSVRIDRGHDGFLRGRPEPVLVVAGIAVGGATAVTLDTTCQPLRVKQGAPCRIEPRDPVSLLSVKASGATRMVLLALAFERDSGAEVDRLSRALSAPDDWTIRAGDSTMAAPFRLGELCLFPPHTPPDGQQVRVSYRGQDLARRCVDDDWVGASMVVLSATPWPSSRWALRFVSDDGRNDWLAEVSITVG